MCYTRAFLEHPRCTVRCSLVPPRSSLTKGNDQGTKHLGYASTPGGWSVAQFLRQTKGPVLVKSACALVEEGNGIESKWV